MTSKIPPLLELYLALPPEASLILLTSVLGASTNWLVLRFLHSALASPEDEDTKVVFVSFMREGAYWREGSRRLGFDLEKLAAKKRFVFVDGLSGLFVPKPPKTRPGERVLGNTSLEHISKEILDAIQSLNGVRGKTMLIVDQLDLLLAAGGDGIGAMNVEDMLMSLREEVYATIVTLAADLPLVSAQQTPLERDHAAYLLGVAHQADFTMGLRMLDTGTARDVSGVIRITVGNQAEEGDLDVQKRIEERELLYFVTGDGSARVFERGQ